MTSAFEIFRVEPEGSVRWLEAAASLHQAENRARQFADRAPGAYIILDSATGEKHIFDLAPTSSSADGDSGAQGLRFPQWEGAYRDVLKEGDLQELVSKVNAAETAIFHRLQQLQIVAAAGDEKLAIQEALQVLLVVKTEKLNFPGVSPSVTQDTRQPDSAPSRHTVPSCPGADA